MNATSLQIVLGCGLLAGQVVDAQSPSGEESIVVEAPEERCDFCGLKTPEGPVKPADPVKRATLRELAIQADYSRSDYRAHCLTPGRFHVRIIDPLLGATLALDREDTGFFWNPWCLDAPLYEPGYSPYSLPDSERAVTIQISPDWGLPPSGYLVPYSDQVPLTSFTRMELLRDDILVQPSSTLRAREGTLRYTVRAAYHGSYEYPPEAFTPGAEVVLRIWREDNESLRPNTRRLNERLLNSISRNFELYYEAMSSE